MFGTAFSEHKITVQAVRATGDGTIPDLFEILPNGDTEIVNADHMAPVYVGLLAFFGAYFMYIFGKYYCSIR